MGIQNQVFPTGSAFVPLLYIGTDGCLHGGFWMKGTGGRQIHSPKKVNDGKWHHVALVGGSSGESLYLDGEEVGSLEG